jgi:hypothetical protein
MGIKDIEAGAANIDASFVVVFVQRSVCSAVMVRTSLQEYGIAAPWVPSAMSAKHAGKSGTGVNGVIFQLKGLVLIGAYIAGARTAPAHPLAVDCGHGTFLRARAKWVCRARRLKKLGRGSRLGGFARRPMMVS